MTQGPKAPLLQGMRRVTPNHERLMKENIFGLFRSYFVTLPVLGRVSFIPVESDALPKRVAHGHNLYISHMYKWRDGIFGRKRVWAP
jgi:hypothetical protein